MISIATPRRFTSRNDGIGRHEGLKIPWSERIVWVRVPLPVQFGSVVEQVDTYVLGTYVLGRESSSLSRSTIKIFEKLIFVIWIQFSSVERYIWDVEVVGPNPAIQTYRAT